MISKIDEPSISLKWQKYNPGDIIKQVVDQLESKIKEKNLEITLENSNCNQLIGDTHQIAQIFRILIDNAIKYSLEGDNISIHMSGNYTGKYNPKNCEGTLIEIIDTGRGITNEDLKFIFRRFFRSDDVAHIPGTGLGLSIAQELLVLHQGEIYAESDLEWVLLFPCFFPTSNKFLNNLRIKH